MPGKTKFWDRVAEGYAKRPVADEAAYQKKLEVTRGYLRPHMQVLEIGCGTGSTAIVHAPHVRHIRAVDISNTMLDIARRKAAAANIANITFEQADVDTLSVPDQSVDIVLALSILHLLEDRDAAVAKIHKMLKPGGFLVSSTVCLGDTMKWFKLVGPIGKFFGLMPLVRVFTAEQLATSLTAAGFIIDHQWRPAKRKAALKAVFIVAKKPG